MVSPMTTEFLVLSDAEDIERYYSGTTGMVPDFMQLSRGQVNLQMHAVYLDGVSIIWTRSGGKQRWRDTMEGQDLHFGFALQSEGPIISRGREIGPHDAQVWLPRREMELVMQGPLFTVDIGVAAALVEQLGWRLDGEPTLGVNPAALDRLAATCHGATLAGSRQDFAGGDEFRTSRYWREEVLDALEPVLRPWMQESIASPPGKASGSRSFQLVKRAEVLFEHIDPAKAIDMDHLAAELGVARRTLFHAFRTHLGVGPRRYFELRRLYALRARLRQGDAANTTITAVASQLGFSELGRLAGLYRNHFGESPSQTLKNAPH